MFYTPCSSVSIVNFEQVNADWELAGMSINNLFFDLHGSIFRFLFTEEILIILTGPENKRSRRDRFSFSQHYFGTTEATILHYSSICIMPDGFTFGYISGA